MSNQKISIVMPVKNAALYLEACFESILKQTEENWELIAVDDHSSDSSLTILQHFQSKDQRISAYSNLGDGIIPALQMAYSKSSGAFIHRMDADDLMPKQKLYLLKALLLKHGKGYVATAKVKYFAKNGVSEGYKKYEDWLNRLCEHDTHWKEIYKECVIASPCWLIHRNDFEQVGGFNSSIYPEDYDLVFRFYQHQLQVVSSSAVLHEWRDHSERTSRNHIHYQQNAFFEIKLHYFLTLERDSTKPLVIWGAGPKGKIMAKLLNERNIPFTWVSNNPKKEGKEIYQQIMQSFEKILTINQPQVIVTVAQRDSKDEIVDFLEKRGLKNDQDYWFFR